MWHQYLRVAVFLLAILGVYLGATLFALRRRRGLRPARRAVRLLEIALYLGACTGTLCIVYAFAIEPYWPEVTHVTLTSAKLRQPLRIVQISDLHCEGKIRLEERLPALIQAQHPDLIVFTGDTLVEPEGMPVAQKVLSQLSAIAPTYVVLGNWDVRWARVWHQSLAHPNFFAGTGVHNLTGQGETVELHGERLWLSGAASSQENILPAMLESAPPDDYSIFLFHFPDEVEVVEHSKVDLYLAGHTHGGQIALPFYGALMTLSKYDKQYESGLHRIGAAWLYVNRGIGLEGHQPKARFWARPEITVLDVLPQPPAGQSAERKD